MSKWSDLATFIVVVDIDDFDAVVVDIVGIVDDPVAIVVDGIGILKGKMYPWSIICPASPAANSEAHPDLLHV